MRRVPLVFQKSRINKSITIERDNPLMIKKRKLPRYWRVVVRRGMYDLYLQCAQRSQGQVNDDGGDDAETPHESNTLF